MEAPPLEAKVMELMTTAVDITIHTTRHASQTEVPACMHCEGGDLGADARLISVREMLRRALGQHLSPG